MTKPREPKKPQTHTVVKRQSSSWLVEYYCTSCGKYLNHDEINKRCKGGQR